MILLQIYVETVGAMCYIPLFVYEILCPYHKKEDVYYGSDGTDKG